MQAYLAMLEINLLTQGIKITIYDNEFKNQSLLILLNKSYSTV